MNRANVILLLVVLLAACSQVVAEPEQPSPSDVVSPEASTVPDGSATKPAPAPPLFAPTSTALDALAGYPGQPKGTATAICDIGGTESPVRLQRIDAAGDGTIMGIGLCTGPATATEKERGIWGDVPTLILLGAEDTTVMPTDLPLKAADQLRDISVVSAREAWAVGSTLAPGAEEWWQRIPLVLHWNGKTWTREATAPFPEHPTDGASPVRFLEAVTAVAADDVWISGHRDIETDDTRTLVLEHWDGKAWTVADTQVLTLHNAAVSSLAAGASDDVWAVGNVSKGLLSMGTEQLALHWDGSSWTPTRASEGFLTRVEVAPDGSAFALGGTTGTPDPEAPIDRVFRWDGKEWVPVDPLKKLVVIDDLSVTTGGHLWVAGSAASKDPPYPGPPLAVGWHKGQWKEIRLPTGSSDVAPMATIGPEAWAIDRVYGRDLWERLDGRTPLQEPPPVVVPFSVEATR